MLKQATLGNLITKLSRELQEKAEIKRMPDWLDPMLAKLTGDYFSGEDWIFERKLDGERVLSYLDVDGHVRLMSRNQKILNDSYPEIQQALLENAVTGCILDGEMVAFDDETLKNLRNRLDDIERDSSPYDQGKPEITEVHFVSPEFVCEVAFSEWTEEDRLRHPRYKGLRRDKPPQDVHKEEESQTANVDEEGQQ